MPDRDVTTLRHVIYFQYAKIIACRAFNCANGMEAKKRCYGFIKKTFRDLVTGQMNWSDIEREDWQFVESDKACAYCGATENLAREHIVPGSLRINDGCPTCDAIQAIHNKVWACKACNSSKGTDGLYSFYKKRFPTEKKFYDILPPLVEKKYLKTVHLCLGHCAQCLDSGDLDGDNEMTVLDIDYALQHFGHLHGA
jgi:hypothetical protein